MAATLSSLLPAPLHNEEPSQTHQQSSGQQRRPLQSQDRELAAKSAAQLSLVATGSTKSKAPAYGQRKGWIPSKPEDYGDGGAL